ncbi:heme-binding peroxidase [Acrasis kona]|uniref:Heme-binding peroxidase n=1 Tax=Acrasis kona TaxID=1008807 RepID=A0AAW2ZMT0_9EUKA
MEKYTPVKEDIKGILGRPGYDDDSIAPLLVRLAWHSSGTYDGMSKTGGSNGATMRFHPESNDGANAGLDKARDFLQPIKEKHPWITYADLWTLGGCVAIESMGGPQIPWIPGRTDRDSNIKTTDDIPPNGRLPDASKGQDHVRQIFYRMGFNDREIVALLGAHTIGRCHVERSGYTGPWTYTPTRFTNQYFKLLTTVDWQPKKWDGPLQYVDPDDELMMLPSDMAVLWDPEFSKVAHEYAKDKDLFFKDFAAAFGKMIDLGVPRNAHVSKL